MAKFFLILILICAATGASANAVKQYPPYPDVWGYDLSGHQAIRDNECGYFNSYKMENGDYAFRFVSSRKPVERDPFTVTVSVENMWLKFFEGITEEASSIEFYKLLDRIPLEKHIRSYEDEKITFSNGHTLEKMEHANVARCCSDDEIKSHYLSKKDEKGNEIARYSVVVAVPKARMFREINESHECPIADPRGYTDTQLYYLPYGFTKLEDDTFLLYSYNLIVRFDQNFNTKFKPKVSYRTRDGRILKRNLFVLPFEAIDEIYSNVKKKKIPALQGFQDDLMSYLIENYNE